MKIDLKCGDNVALTREYLADESIDLTVTSPPYGSIRDYGGHTWSFESLAKELYRVTKQGGVVVWVVGDETIDGSESGASFRQALFFVSIGFNLHDTMIYEKNNFANPSSNRYHQIFEYMFVLSKGTPKTFNPVKDKINAYAGQSNWGKNLHRQKDGSQIEHAKRIVNPLGVRNNIWRYTTSYGFAGDTNAYDHPAVFPEALARDHILSWSNEGDTVFEPFLGSGTTGKMAVILNRNFVGFEIHAPYMEIARERIDKALAMQGLGDLVISKNGKETVKMSPLFASG